jgi:hypothetical protein
MLALIYLSGLIFSYFPEPGYLFGVTGSVLLFAIVGNALFNSARFKEYNKMLTFKMGNIYLVICSTLFQAYNLIIIQLKLYQYFPPALTGVLFAVLLIMLSVTFYSVTKTQLKAVTNCKELKEKYALVV